MAEDERRSQTLQNCRIIAALVFCAFAWVAILTFAVTDWPNNAVWPQNDPVHNACGRAGAWFAYELIFYLGEGIYPLLFLLTLAALLRFLRRPVGDLPLRLAGLCVLVTITATAAALIDPSPSTGLVEGRGGILGIAVGDFLKRNLSTFGTTLVVAAAYIVGFLLAADELIVLLPRGVAFLRRRGAEIIAALRNAGRVSLKVSIRSDTERDWSSKAR